VRYVLILSRSNDSHVSPVAEEIRVRGSGVIWFNVADFPEQVRLSATLGPLQMGWDGTLTYQDQQLPLDSLTSIWRRRPKPYKAPQTYSPGERAFIEEEADRALLGVLDSLGLEGTLWVSRTHSVRRADFKPLQMATAQHLGLRVPRTLITNLPSAARDFYDICQGNIVLKSVSRGMIEREDQQIGRFLYTSQVEASHIVPELLKGVRATGHLLQEYIPKRLEIRVVVIGKRVFAAEIHSQSSERARVDFRRAYDELSYDVHTLPDEIQQKVLALVHHFDLQFSSMDLLLTPEGEYVFIDLNPNGQFYWLQLHLADRLPLKEAMADLLVYPEEYRL
jgi:hypothetical protein